MLDFTFQTARSLLCAPGASARIGELTANLHCRHVLLVCDPGVLGAGLPDRALAGLAAAGIAVTGFTDVRADPPEEIVEAGVAAARAAGVDGIVGLGGGSSLDVAKLVALLAPGTERLDDIYGVGLAKGPRLPLILAPTTAGTGSEVTPIAIVTTRSGEKRGVVSPPLLPDWAVLDADLTLKLPPHVSAATGIDAMVHAVEAITSKRLRNPVSDALAREALRLIGANIRTVCRDGANRWAREAMLLGSALAGMAFANAPVAAVHALAYPVGARFHVPHGLSNAMVLPGVLAFNAPAAAADYADIAQILFPEHPGRSLGESFAALAAEIGLDIRLRSAGITEADLPALAEDAMRQTRLLVNNPREMSEADALAIYRAAL
ncbi:iron-containing alcohol dehydrogenase [Aureimonas sp. AU12]|uniref:iron-containing alcohol dehydrogenase n=1 Tax=Aureimonas sp. AU12 TaxID=1638161 RepID=UPI0007833B48|nr:iron-containing alcohol dehydrogenase [Aureimonas sp. AU12]